MVRSYPVVLKNMFKTTIKHTKQFSNMFCSKEGLDLISIIPLQPFKQKNQRNKTQKTSRWLFQPVFFFSIFTYRKFVSKKTSTGIHPFDKTKGPEVPGTPTARTPTLLDQLAQSDQFKKLRENVAPVDDEEEEVRLDVFVFFF